MVIPHYTRAWRVAYRCGWTFALISLVFKAKESSSRHWREIGTKSTTACKIKLMYPAASGNSCASRRMWWAVIEVRPICTIYLFEKIQNHLPIPVAAHLLWLFESRGSHGFLCFVNVVCCQVEVSATGRSLLQRSPTEWCVWVWLGASVILYTYNE